MEKMITRFCRECKNWFDYKQPKYFGDITVSSGELVGFSDRLQNGQYFRIVGSVFNDGVYKYPASDMTDETFSEGAVWAMAIPKEVIELCEKMTEWENSDDVKYALSTPYQSESKADYSYSLKSGIGSTTADGGAYDVWSQFAGEISMWRKP